MKIKNKESFLEFLNLYTGNHSTWIFRGVESDKYKLIPSIGRVKYKNRKRKLTEKDEDLMFRFFKQRATRFLNIDHDEMNLLAIAQHHGLPTRLLDWTFNPLVAAYFAVEKKIIQPQKRKDKIASSIIYVYEKGLEAKINENYEYINVNKLEFFVPNHCDQRIVNQSVIFTVHPYPWTEHKSDKLQKIPIALSYRRELRQLLNEFGINQATMFPGLDGTTNHIKWMETDFY